MNNKRIQVISFLVILVAVVILVALVLKPFLTIIAFGAILAVLFRPLYNRLERKLKSPAIASALTLLIIVLIFLIPVVLFGNILFNEILQVYGKFSRGDLVIDRDQIISGIPVQLQTIIENISRDMNKFLNSITAHAFETFSSLVSNVFGFFISIFLLLFTVYYLLRDGATIKKVFIDLSPLATSQEDTLIEKVSHAINGVVKGSFLMALIQGVIATVGFLIFGVPQPFLWGTFTVLAALVPTVGTALALVPAIGYLIITGHPGQAIGLTIWGSVAVGLIDNFLGAKVVGSRTNLHPLLILFSVLGGLQFFGFLGFLLGPILMAVCVALINIYRTDFKANFEEK